MVFNHGIRFGQDLGISRLIHFHQGARNWLSINGKKFDNVKGQEPFYLDINPTGFIFFVTSDLRDRQYVYHFVHIKDEKRSIEIPVDYTFLGSGVGHPATGCDRSVM